MLIALMEGSFSSLLVDEARVLLLLLVELVLKNICRRPILSFFLKILLEADLRIFIEKIMNIVEAIPVAQLCG